MLKYIWSYLTYKNKYLLIILLYLTWKTHTHTTEGLINFYNFSYRLTIFLGKFMILHG